FSRRRTNQAGPRQSEHAHARLALRGLSRARSAPPRQTVRMALHPETRKLARHGRIRTRRPVEPMSEPPHSRQADPRKRSRRLGGPSQQASRKGQLTIHHRRCPREAQKALPLILNDSGDYLAWRGRLTGHESFDLRSGPFHVVADWLGVGRRHPKEPHMTYANIIVETHGRVGLIRLNRPQALNALSSPLIEDLNAALEAFEADPEIGAIVLTGSEKAFAAGADIREMQDKSFADVFLGDFISRWENVSKTRKPVIAAVAGFALGGGCELAMMCDFILAADTAKFGQPEIKLGVMPGVGGTQRLTRFVGKSKAMEMCLTGRMMDAAEAERSGLVSRVVPAASLIEEALKTAATIASMSTSAVYATKESVNRAYETTLAEGIRFERRIFHSLFATEDQKEGMRAFVEKRPAAFRNR